MSLPGLGRIGISLTYYADEKSGYLWVSDASGDAHLFWDELGDEHKLFPNWRRSALRHDASQVILGSASWRTLAGDFVISQARRNDHVEIRRYRFDRTEDARKEPLRIPAAVGSSDWHRLLQKGSMDEVRERVRNAGEDAEGWDPDALLAELFDLLADDSESMKGLNEFLGNPTADLARLFLEKLKDYPPERSGQAVKAWTYALLGAIHHSRQGDKESLYRGIIRWLRAITEMRLPKRPEQEEVVHAAAEDQIMFVRKWGLFGDSYAQRSSAAAPLEVLIQQEKKDRRLDRYSYQSLLFQRQVDLEHEDDQVRMAGRTAWDLRTLNVGDRLFVAVSWIRGGVHLHEVVASCRAEGEGVDLVPCEVFRPEPDTSGQTLHLTTARLTGAEGRSDDGGYSRAIVLGTLPEQAGHYLLASPAQRLDTDGGHRFELWRLDIEADRVKVCGEGDLAEATEPLPAALPLEESVYSLLELEPGLVLAGLRGQGGRARVVLLKIQIRGGRVELSSLLPLEELPSSAPQGKVITRNHIWSLALERPAAKHELHHVVFAGCSDGQVWQLRIPRYADAEDRFPLHPLRVERLGAPVWALACRVEMTGGRRVRRVFAGGSDGTILALQELARDEPTFTTVWATHEDDGTIARLHLLAEKEGNNAHPPMLLAVTQQGRCIFFSDRWQIEPPREDSTRHRRLRFPGERHGRPLLGATAFVSDLLVLPEKLFPPRSKEGFARLISATNDGRLRIHTLHFPLYLDQRSAEYSELVSLWLEMVCDGEGDGKRFKPHSLRLVEAAYVASPVAPEVLVRALLEVRYFPLRGDTPDRETMERQWLPHYVRPLFDLHYAWKDFPAQGTPEEVQASLEQVQSSLELALERAWRRQDRGLFVEIMSVVLLRSNFWLFEAADREDVIPSNLQELYGRILTSLEKSMNLWLGFPGKADLLTRMSFAKQLTDGDTLWRLGSSEKLGPILSTRISVIRHLLVFGDPLLALETLRAANIALLRVAKRLVDHGERRTEEGKTGWRPGDPRQELPWISLESYAQTLTDLAIGAFQLTRRVSDALAHEITRSFALLVCVCPSASIRVGQWMAEADLVSTQTPKEDRTQTVLSQLELLADLGAPVPEPAIRLFRWANSTSPEDYKESLLVSEIAESDKIGESNQKVFEVSKPFRAILDWLSRLTDQLSSDASGIDLQKAAQLKRKLKLPKLDLTPAADDPFAHSRRFWTEALGHFETAILKEKRAPSDRIQPEVVLLSRRIVGWCEKTLENLENRTRKHDLFEPQHTIYSQALRNLERAAREFPNSAAVQKNIVLGILGHGLLEALDEHVLELEEIAQALDPLLVWEHRKIGRTSDPGTSGTRAEYFARYLLARSRDAESVPKNLRTLQGLLRRGEVKKRKFQLVRDLLSDFLPDGAYEPDRENCGWFLPKKERSKKISLDAGELRFLRMALKELDQNDRIYGPPRRERTAHVHWPRLELNPGGKRGLRLIFPLGDDEENLSRLRELQDQRLQALYPRREARDVASHGTGLYLANLAAAVVEWRLRIQTLNEHEKWFSFLLEHVVAETRESAQ